MHYYFAPLMLQGVTDVRKISIYFMCFEQKVELVDF